MRRLLFAVAMAITFVHAAEPALPAYDADSPAALEAQAKYASYARDGEALRSSDLYKELARLDGVKKSRMALAKPDELASFWFPTTDDDMRTISYSGVLQTRGERGDPTASFFVGVREWDTCAQFQRQPGDGLSKMAKECWQRVMPAFKRASDAQIADASFNIARLYESGLGVSASKLAAAEWYVNSAGQYSKEKSREEALTSIERALDLVPDHPAALRLRKAMLK